MQHNPTPDALMALRRAIRSYEGRPLTSDGTRRLLDLTDALVPPKPHYLEATPENMARVYGQPGVVAWSPLTGEEYSADAGDYFNHPLTEPLRDDANEPMVLVRVVTEHEPVRAARDEVVA